MTKIITFMCFLCLLTRWMLSAQTPDSGKEFTIRGEIAGLAVGDTLRFERIGFSGLEMTPGFEVVVSTPDRFEYTGRQSHIEYYLMTCLPRTGELPELTKSGLKMLIDGGTVTVTGSLDWIYFSRVDGEAFGEQPLLREAIDLENSIEQEHSRHLQRVKAAFTAGDSVKGREYQQQYYDSYRNDDKSKRVRALQIEFLRRYPSSPWSLAELLRRSSTTPVDTLDAYYGRLDTSARNSLYGTLLRKKIDDLKRMLPGQPAPDFKVTLQDGTVMDSEKFRGKYLLIYHWGFCPGSIQREKDATELYDRFKDHFEILGITASLDAIREAARTTHPDNEFDGINLRATYESMSVHPWFDVEDGTGENHKISELYIFAGFPYFILISPDGKIVSRGFHETFFEAKEILENQYDKKQ